MELAVMNYFSASTLRFAVDQVYSAIDFQEGDRIVEADEQVLWRLLSCCILSSQVTYELALSVATTIEKEGALPSNKERWQVVASNLDSILSGTFLVAGRPCRYRFAKSKSYQIAKTWWVIRSQSGTLADFLTEFSNMVTLREWMVRYAPGLGPKQASMFLRNAGLTLDLAVLDRHVLRYMESIELLEVGGRHTTTLRKYRTTEGILQRHADELGYCVGVMDWAIWIVMRVARSKGLATEYAS